MTGSHDRIYQHANRERDREIADAMDRRITKQAKRATDKAKQNGQGQEDHPAET